MPTIDEHPDSLRLRSLIDLHTAVARVIDHESHTFEKTLQIFPLEGAALSLTLSLEQQRELVKALRPTEFEACPF